SEILHGTEAIHVQMLELGSGRRSLRNVRTVWLQKLSSQVGALLRSESRCGSWTLSGAVAALGSVGRNCRSATAGAGGSAAGRQPLRAPRHLLLSAVVGRADLPWHAPGRPRSRGSRSAGIGPLAASLRIRPVGADAGRSGEART